MLRTNTCGELRITDVDQEVILCGWVQRVRDKGKMIWVDLRDRYGITQLIVEERSSRPEIVKAVKKLGREFVIKTRGKVVERYSKNNKIPTGDIEIKVDSIEILNPSKLPPFLIENETDGGEDLRMRFRYLDLRREPIKQNLFLRNELMKETRKYLESQQFIEIETPILIKSTPEGARDFVVPSRMNQGQFYALPQSPQTFKQLLMVAGFDKYFQLVRCFRDEDLRADRQPEFTQIDCEMAFVEQDDVLNAFEGLIKHIFKSIKGIELNDFPRLSYQEVIARFGSDKPDLRFEMEFIELNEIIKGKGFNVLDNAELVIGICAKGCGRYSRKQTDNLTDFVRRPQIGSAGLAYIKYDEDGTIKSSMDKFYSESDLLSICKFGKVNPGDLLLILAGNIKKTRFALSELRLEMGSRLELRSKEIFCPLWVVDFPLLDWDEDDQRYTAMHHPFTSPKNEDIEMLLESPGKVRANAYDLVINGVELGGGSIRIHKKDLQKKMFKALGISDEEADQQFGFLMEAFEYGAPPHGGIAFGFDRLCAILGGTDSIRDYIAFPKNNSGRDTMINTPAPISIEQLNELSIKIVPK